MAPLPPVPEHAGRQETIGRIDGAANAVLVPTLSRGRSCWQAAPPSAIHTRSIRMRRAARRSTQFSVSTALRGHPEQRKVLAVQLLYQAIDRIARTSMPCASRLEDFLFGAPHVALITTDEDLGIYGVLDCGLYVANFHAGCADLGVASIAQAALASYPDFVRDHFGLPQPRWFAAARRLYRLGAPSCDRYPHRARPRSRVGDLDRSNAPSVRRC